MTYFPLGEDKFAALLPALRQAKHFIFLEYFIVEEGEMWGQVLSILVEKVKQGVEVRVLVDDHERMSAFLRVIQQISTDSMRCTSRMMRIADWRQGVREMTEPDIAKMLNGKEPGESE